MRNPMPRNTKIRALRTALWKEMPKSFCEPSCVPTIIARTTPPNRHAPSRFNRIRCFSLMRSLRSRKQRRHADCSLASFARSCRPSQPLAEDAGGPDQQDQDQHAEADHVVPLRADEVERGDQPLGLAEDQPADHGAADVADAAENGGGERLDTRREAHQVADPERRAEEESGDAGERP